MRATKDFIFIHMPKTGGTWLREVLQTAHHNMFFHGTPLGKVLLVLTKLFPGLKERIIRDFSLLFLYEYSHSKTMELPAGFAAKVPYQRAATTRAVLGLLRGMGLLKPTPPLAMLLVHTRRAQLPAAAVRNMRFFAGISNPLRWHISRYNFYKKNDPNNRHATAMCDLVGKFEDFTNYCNQQMPAMRDIYFKSYLAYISSKNNAAEPDDYNYPTEVIPWYSRAVQDAPSTATPKHYGLLSFFFIWFFLPQPQRIITLSAADYEEYLASHELKRELKNFSFAHTQNLNNDTYEFLKSRGYPQEAIAFIPKLAPRNVSTVNDNYAAYYNKTTLAKIYELEKLIFILFPQYEDAYRQIKL